MDRVRAPDSIVCGSRSLIVSLGGTALTLGGRSIKCSEFWIGANACSWRSIALVYTAREVPARLVSVAHEAGARISRQGAVEHEPSRCVERWERRGAPQPRTPCASFASQNGKIVAVARSYLRLLWTRSTRSTANADLLLRGEPPSEQRTRYARAAYHSQPSTLR